MNSYSSAERTKLRKEFLAKCLRKLSGNSPQQLLREVLGPNYTPQSHR
jgi:hypothetical protein